MSKRKRESDDSKTPDLNSLVHQGKITEAWKVIKRLKTETGFYKSHSKWKWSTVCSLLGINEVASLEEWELKLGKEDTGAAKSISGSLLKAINKKIKHLGSMMTGKESKRLFFIMEFLIDTLDYIDTHEHKLGYIYVEDNIDGDYSHGPVEFVLKLQGKTVLVVEAKKDNINHGLAQLLMQLTRVLEKQNTAYGFVSTSYQWIAVKGALINHKPAYVMSRAMYIAASKPKLEEIQKVVAYIYHVLKLP